MRRFLLIDFFRNSLWLGKLMIFEQIYRQILRAYVNIWSKNLTIKMPKMAILAIKWNFERSLIFIFFSLNAEEPWGKDADLAQAKLSSISSLASENSVLVQISSRLIQFHQDVVSPCDGPRSHFRPSSSQYTLDAIRKYGFIAGVPMGCDRLMRENNDPWIYRKTVDEQGDSIKWDPVR